MAKKGPGGVAWILYLAETEPIFLPSMPLIASIIGTVPNATILSESELS